MARCKELMVPGPKGRNDLDDRILAFGKCGVRPLEEAITAAVDSTGLSLSKYGSWLTYRWNKKAYAGWIKLHAAVNVGTNEILAYAITDERMGDVSCLGLLMEMVFEGGHNVGGLLADAAYDKKDVWRKYDAEGIHVAINIKSPQLGKHAPENPSGIRSHGCTVRGRHIDAYSK